MTDKKFTDEDIIKALECCGNQMYVCTDKQCRAKTLGDAVDFIKSQKADIDRLKGSTIVSNIMESQRIKREAKIEAYKEFAKNAIIRLTDNYRSEYAHWIDDTIDGLLKEMIGEKPL